MANEFTVTTTLQVKNGELFWRSPKSSFKADQSTSEGPTPGMLSVDSAGEDVDLSEITGDYGFIHIENIETDPGDGTKDVDFGIWDGTNFFPLGVIVPGEHSVFRLSPRLGQEFTTGTGTSGASDNSLRLKSVSATAKVVISAFAN